jgi:hypothetical protein
VQMVKYLSAVRQGHQESERDKFKITYLFEANLQPRGVEQLLYLLAEDLLQGHLLQVERQQSRVRHHRCHMTFLHKMVSRGWGGGAGGNNRALATTLSTLGVCSILHMCSAMKARCCWMSAASLWSWRPSETCDLSKAGTAGLQPGEEND